MTPLRLEAAYERIQQGPLAGSVRWGFRATLDRTSRPDEEASPPTFAAALPIEAQRALAARIQAPDGRTPRREEPTATARTVAPGRRGPREAEPVEVAAYPEVLGYGPNGWVIPMLPGSLDGSGRGVALNLLA